MKNENKKIVAKFMGFEFIQSKSKYNVTEDFYLNDVMIPTYKFDQSWDWLMPVVEKIETLELPSYIDFHIMPDAVIVHHQDDEDNPLILINKSECKGSAEIEPTMFETKIQAVYDAVVILIKWYNLHIQHEQL